MKRLFFFAFLFVSCHARAQITTTTAFRIRPLTTAPATCIKGDVYVDSSVTPAVPYYCSNTNTWSAFVSGGGAGVGGSGTTNTIAKFTAGSTIGDSAATDDASTVTVTNRAFNLTGTTGVTPASGAGTRLMWIPAKNAFRAGIVSGTQWDNANIASGSHAIGDNDQVTITQGIAIGTNNTVSGLTAQNAAFGFANSIGGTGSNVAVGLSNTTSGTAINTVVVGVNATCTGSATCFGTGTGGTHTGSSNFAFMGGPILHYGATSGALTLAVPATVTSYTITWPSAQGAASTNLQNDGSGNLSWVAGGGITGLTTNAIPKAASATTLTDSLLFSGVNANVVEQRSGTTGQKFDVYRTYTGATNFEKLSIEGSGTESGYSGLMTVTGHYGSGGGSARDLFLGVKDAGGTVRGWVVQSASGTGHLVPDCIQGSCDSSLDLGSNSGDGSHGWVRNLNMRGTIIFDVSENAKQLSFAAGSDPILTIGAASFTQSATRFSGMRPAARTGTNQNGQNLLLTTGLGTGTGATGRVHLQAAAGGTASGSTAHTNVDRFITNASLGLTSGTAATLFTVALATLQMTGGHIRYTIESTDGTDMQATTGVQEWSAVNKAGTYTTSIAIVGTETTASSSGTLTSTWSITTGTNLINVRVTATSTVITPTTMRITYAVENFGQTAVTIQ